MNHSQQTTAPAAAICREKINIQSHTAELSLDKYVIELCQRQPEVEEIRYIFFLLGSRKTLHAVNWQPTAQTVII